MSYIDDAVGLSKVHEGFSDIPYLDTLGNWTVAYGRALYLNPITEEEGEYLLRSDMTRCVIDLSTFPWFQGLNDARKAALLDMRFNLGPTGFRRFKKMIAALKAEDYGDAAAEMLDSRWAKQVKGRALTLAEIMIRGHTHPH